MIPTGGRTRPAARVCELTPAARGAVAVLRVWGPDALAVADRVFRPATRTKLSATATGLPRFGRAGAGLGDEVIAVVVAAAGGRQGDPAEVEFHCHGGPEPVALVIEALVAAGAERRRPSAWVRHDARSTAEAEARVDLARAPTLRAAEILLEQAAGALAREVAGVTDLLATDPAAALAALDRLIGRSAVGLRLVGGWSVALAGRPNVGKSRLMNALAGFERSIVDPTPGTTRDVVTARTALDGWAVELADTAGLRVAADEVEAAGVALARRRQKEADLVVVVLDRSEPLTDADRSVLASWPAALVVANKGDLAAAWDGAGTARLVVSAERGDGLPALVEAIARRLAPDPPGVGVGVPFRPGQVRRLDAARASLRAGDDASASADLAKFRAGAKEEDPSADDAD